MKSFQRENQFLAWPEKERYCYNTRHLVSTNRNIIAWNDQSTIESSGPLISPSKIFETKRGEAIIKLEERRSKLLILLETEKEAYKSELDKKKEGVWDINTMNQRLETLISLKEKKRQDLVKTKLHQHWEKNEPTLREAESRRFEKEIAKNWKGQVENKKRVNQDSLQTERNFEQTLKKENQKYILEEKNKMHERKAKAKMLAKEQQRQFFELKKKEEEAEFLKIEDRKLQESEELIYKTTTQRNLLLEQKNKQKYGSFLILQNKHNLLRKNKQIQEDLQNDLELLKEIKKKEEDEYKLNIILKNEKRKDVLYMQSVLENQLQIEKIREVELNKLYQQESALQWQKRNAEWEREKVAREKLISNVLEERKNQIQIKRKTLNLIKEETVRERELLLEELEKHQLSTQREDLKQELKKKQFEFELREQILNERSQRKLEKKSEERENHLKSLQKSINDERLTNEIVQLTGQEPCFRRRRIPFT